MLFLCQHILPAINKKRGDKWYRLYVCSSALDAMPRDNWSILDFSYLNVSVRLYVILHVLYSELVEKLKLIGRLYIEGITFTLSQIEHFSNA